MFRVINFLTIKVSPFFVVVATNVETTSTTKEFVLRLFSIQIQHCLSCVVLLNMEERNIREFFFSILTLISNYAQC
jgi:hypothetical protein